MNRKVAATLLGSLFLFCLLLSACTPPDTSPADIKKTVESFMVEVKDGTYAKNDFISPYMMNQPFQNIQPEDPRMQQKMEEGMQRIYYQVGEATGSVKEAVGTCSVKVIALDAAGIAKELQSFEAFDEAFQDQLALTVEKTIDFKMVYDAEAKVWLIKDGMPISDLLGMPYLSIDVDPETLDAADLFIQAVVAEDTEKIEALSAGYTSYDFYSASYEEEKIMKKAFGMMTYTLTLLDEEVYENGMPQPIQIVFSMPDLKAIDEKLLADETLVTEIFRITYLDFSENNDFDAAVDKSFVYYTEMVLAELDKPDVPMMEVTGEISFARGIEAINSEDGIVVDTVPTELFGVGELMVNFSPALSRECSQKAYEALLDEGLVTSEVLDRLQALDNDNESAS